MSSQEQDNVPGHHREGEALVFDPPEDTKEVARRRREDEQHEFARSQVKTNKTLAWFTGALVLATFCTIGVGIWQACIYGGQLGVMRDQLDQMNKQFPEIQKSATAAQDAGTTASNALDASERQFQIDERPYMVKEYMKVEKPVVGSKLYGEILWRDTGRTPAFHGRIYTHIDILEKEPTDYEGWVKEAREKSKGYLEFGSSLTRATPVTGQNPLDQFWMDRLNSKRYRVYMFGALVYDDIFHDSHTTYFCAWLDPDSTLPENMYGKVVYSLSACTSGNEVK